MKLPNKRLDFSFNSLSTRALTKTGQAFRVTYKRDLTKRTLLSLLRTSMWIRVAMRRSRPAESSIDEYETDSESDITGLQKYFDNEYLLHNERKKSTVVKISN